MDVGVMLLNLLFQDLDLFIFWLDWLVGRKYVRAVSTTKNPAESEIIINVPLALKIMTTGYIWPISAWQELISGDLVAPEDEVTVSPR
jgi:photosystem I subunit 3